jgi:hypothetical protein
MIDVCSDCFTPIQIDPIFCWGCLNYVSEVNTVYRTESQALEVPLLRNPRGPTCGEAGRAHR